MSRPVIQLRAVSFAYGARQVIDAADLCIDEHELVAIVGPNGGGKTTLLKLMLGLLEPRSGEISVLEQPPRRARKLMGYVPQQAGFDPLFPVTVEEVVLLGCIGQTSPWGLFGRADKQQARASLAAVGLAELWHRPFAALSGGQRQRVLIARALVGRPQILLLDEPTANLDPQVGYELFEMLTALNRELTIVLVSHDMEFVMRAVSTAICVNGTVHIHPTSELTGSFGAHLAGDKLRRVRHDIAHPVHPHHEHEAGD